MSEGRGCEKLLTEKSTCLKFMIDAAVLSLLPPPPPRRVTDRWSSQSVGKSKLWLWLRSEATNELTSEGTWVPRSRERTRTRRLRKECQHPLPQSVVFKAAPSPQTTEIEAGELLVETSNLELAAPSPPATVPSTLVLRCVVQATA